MSKKAKTGSIAVPYLITIFVGIILIGGGTMFALNYFGIIGRSHELKEPTPKEVNTATYEDSHSILFVLDEPDQKSKYTFMLMRSIPKEKKVVLVGIPSNALALVDGSQMSMREAYENGGMTVAVTFASELFGVNIDRYMKLNSRSFIKICDVLGGVTYAVPEDVAGFSTEDGSEQYLNSEQVERLILYSLYPDGEVERACMAARVFSKMINGADLERVAGNLDATFTSLINMVDDTNITSADYKKRKVGMKYMLENGTTIASYYVMDGDESYNDFIPNPNFFSDLRQTYFKELEEGESKKND